MICLKPQFETDKISKGQVVYYRIKSSYQRYWESWQPAIVMGSKPLSIEVCGLTIDEDELVSSEFHLNISDIIDGTLEIHFPAEYKPNVSATGVTYNADSFKVKTSDPT